VSISSGGMPEFDILDHRPAGATSLTVGGLPAYVAPDTTDTGTGAELTLTWTIARPGSVDNFYSITAHMRGPGLPQMRS
jgi:hypothetical protein